MPGGRKALPYFHHRRLGDHNGHHRHIVMHSLSARGHGLHFVAESRKRLIQCIDFSLLLFLMSKKSNRARPCAGVIPAPFGFRDGVKKLA